MKYTLSECVCVCEKERETERVRLSVSMVSHGCATAVDIGYEY